MTLKHSVPKNMVGCWSTTGLLALLIGCSSAAPRPQQPSGVVVMTGDEATLAQDPPAPPLRVNQVGYLPDAPKYAVLASDAKQPLTWELLDSKGQVLLSGSTTALGVDSDSGDALHRIDFSAFKGTASGVSLRVGKDRSAPFDVRADVFRSLKSDAVAYFYHNRSGIPIEVAYVGQEKWTRPAGHLSDKSVPCAKDAGCTYSLDVTKGWYDAGDFGKYVVNGGIATWTLLALYERMQAFAPSSLADFADGALRIPERGNKVPDLLDEARWEVEFLLKMQVPEGQPLAGMAHHKMHDEAWDGMGVRAPTEISPDQPRILRPPSTAATLNLAAVAAQAARIYRPFDGAFADQCLKAAERAYAAALANPNRLAPPTDTIGGGPYDDQRVTDEFYWAAVELYITTKKPEYQAALAKSPFHQHIPDGSGEDGKGIMTPMTWQSVSGLGTISLAVVPNDLGAAEIQKARSEIIRHAEAYLAMTRRSGYRIPFQPDANGFPWGSNSFIVNNALAIALAYDFTKDPRYATGVLDAANYLLGQNAMGRCYVTGYGTNPVKNPHHRFWAHQELADFPEPPPGALVGGPNSLLSDPPSQDAKLDGCKPMKCYIDHIKAWSLNEITINWNAPLVWFATFLDERSR